MSNYYHTQKRKRKKEREKPQRTYVTIYFWNREDFLHIKATVNIKNKSLKEVILSKGKKILMLTAKKKKIGNVFIVNI